MEESRIRKSRLNMIGMTYPEGRGDEVFGSSGGRLQGELESGLDLWKIIIVLQADGHGEALKAAIPASRALLDSPANFEAMGYFQGPVQYAVLSLSSPVELADNTQKRSVESYTILYCGELTTVEFSKLVSYEDVPATLHAIYLEDPISNQGSGDVN